MPPSTARNCSRSRPCHKHLAMTHRSLKIGIILFIVVAQTECVFNKVRVIDETPLSIKSVVGALAVLPCSVDPRYTEQYADQYKVMWVSPLETVISLQDRRLLNDMRISVERPFIKDWNLHLRNVSVTDAGIYKCQINTVPVGTKKIELIVTEPPRIIDHSMPTDIEKPEGEMVELFCNATGSPQPEISWYRLHKKGNGVRERVGQTGESLVIHNISRMCGDTYECLATNGVEPVASQPFKVTVFYVPEVNLPNSRIGQQVGKDTILDCEVSASPLGYVVWRRNHSESGLSNSESHEVHLYNNNNPDDSITLSLRILKVKPEDYGVYTCVATNSIGTTIRKMELFEIVSKTSPISSTSTTSVYKHIWTNSEHGNKIIEIENNGRVTSHHSYIDPNGVPDGQSSHKGSVMSEYQGTNSANSGSQHSGGGHVDRGISDAGSPPISVARSLMVATAWTVTIIYYMYNS